MTDALLSEYGWSLDYVLFALPLQQAFALFAAIAARYGNERHAPSFDELDILDELDRQGLPAPSVRKGGKRKRRVPHRT